MGELDCRMIQLTGTGLIADPQDVGQRREEFEANHCVLLRGLLAPQLLEFVHGSLEHADWEDYRSARTGAEQVLVHPRILGLLHFIANSPGFLRVADQITGCGPFTWFGGRVYRLQPGAGHYDRWHDDNGCGRLLGMSLNLSSRSYRGGLFQLRRKGSESEPLLAEIANTGPGDAIFIRISGDLVHRVSEVRGSEPRIAFAGWFDATTTTLRSRLESVSGAAGCDAGVGAARRD
jgi:hypothetical protein